MKQKINRKKLTTMGKMKRLFNRLRAEGVEGYYGDWRDDEADDRNPERDYYFEIKSNH